MVVASGINAKEYTASILWREFLINDRVKLQKFKILLMVTNLSILKELMITLIDLLNLLKKKSLVGLNY
jgi:hypothetical protein